MPEFIGSNRCGCGVSKCCRLDGLCCKKDRCRKKCKKPKSNAISVQDINAVFWTANVSAFQGIQWLKHNGTYILVGTNGSSGILNIGPLNALSQTTFSVNFPNAAATSVYGASVPDVNAAPIRLVGTFRNNDSTVVNGFLFSGTVQDLTDATDFKSMQIGPNFTFNMGISSTGDCIVGTNDNAAQHNTFGLALGPINAFVYNISNGNTDRVHFPGSVSNAAYGIWHTGGTSYTICGGYSFSAIDIATVYLSRNGVALPVPFGNAFLVDFDSKTRCFKNWATFNFPEQNIVTDFQGISAVPNRANHFQLAANSASISATNVTQASWVEVKRIKDRCSNRDKFNINTWLNINFPNGGLSQANGVAGNDVVGIVEVDNNIIPFQTQLLIKGFDLSF